VEGGAGCSIPGVPNPMPFDTHMGQHLDDNFDMGTVARRGTVRLLFVCSVACLCGPRPPLSRRDFLPRAKCDLAIGRTNMSFYSATCTHAKTQRLSWSISDCSRPYCFQLVRIVHVVLSRIAVVFRVPSLTPSSRPTCPDPRDGSSLSWARCHLIERSIKRQPSANVDRYVSCATGVRQSLHVPKPSRISPPRFDSCCCSCMHTCHLRLLGSRLTPNRPSTARFSLLWSDLRQVNQITFNIPSRVSCQSPLPYNSLLVPFHYQLFLSLFTLDTHNARSFVRSFARSLVRSFVRSSVKRLLYCPSPRSKPPHNSNKHSRAVGMIHLLDLK
jgi:hypothetical protein